MAIGASPLFFLLAYCVAGATAWVSPAVSSVCQAGIASWLDNNQKDGVRGRWWPLHTVTQQPQQNNFDTPTSKSCVVEELPIVTSTTSVPAPDASSNIGHRLKEGASLLVLPSFVSPEVCYAIVRSTSRLAQIVRDQRLANDDNNGLVRLPTIAAAQRAAATDTPCAAPLDQATDDKVQHTLRHILETIQAQVPSVVETLFGGGEKTLVQLWEDGALEFSSREPAVNVYVTGGHFLAHKDYQALTVLVNLSEPMTTTTSHGQYEGGGTAFWSQDSRGHRVEDPTIVVRPELGSVLLFGGHVTHAGVPVVCGERAVLVASFSLKGGRQEREQIAARSFDIYGDPL